MAETTPMEEKKEKRLIVISSAMFSIAVIFFWMAMPPELFARLMRGTTITWLTGDAEAYHFLSRIRLAVPLGAVSGGIVAFIMTGLFAYHRYQAAFHIRKQNPEGQFYPENLSDQPLWPEDDFPKADLKESGAAIIEDDEIILMPKDSSAPSLREKKHSFANEKTEDQDSVLILGDYSEKAFTKTDHGIQRSAEAKTDAFSVDNRKEAKLPKQQPAFSDNRKETIEKDIPQPEYSSSSTKTRAFTPSLGDATEHPSYPKEREKKEETLFLSSEQILEKPIQDRPHPVSASPTVAIKLSQLDRDQALHQALVLIKEMREQLTLVSKL